MEKWQEKFLSKIHILTFLYRNIDLNMKNISFKFLSIFGGNKQTKNKPEKLAK